MAWHIPQSQTTPGVTVLLDPEDDAFVASGILIVSEANNAIRGIDDNHEVLIYGTAASLATDTVRLGLAGATVGQLVTIKPSGHVQNFSPFAGVYFPSSDSKVINQGLISSPFGSGIEIDGDSTTTQSEITNSDTIEGLIGILHSGIETLVTTNSGLISGGSMAYEGSTGLDLITNTGRMVGDIQLNGGNDVYDGASGRLTGAVFGGGGRDTITGGIDNDHFEGGGNNDTLIGNGGNDMLLGDAGIDTLRGGAGRDLLTGGLDADTFDFNAISESGKGSANRDQILDFSRSQGDKIDVSGIDADTSANSGNDIFEFIGKDAFNGGGGELRFIDHGTFCTVQGDTDGDRKADFEIRVMVGSLREGDFML
ncbi:MAG: hypothetical protein FJX44_07580 [Alphaproteobacteria bacterium]|nr:hypothetical protein [Alphaproteobacteria bacterium]